MSLFYFFLSQFGASKSPAVFFTGIRDRRSSSRPASLFVPVIYMVIVGLALACLAAFMGFARTHAIVNISTYWTCCVDVRRPCSLPASWCQFADTPSVVVAKMDADKHNAPAEYKLESFPTILFLKVLCGRQRWLLFCRVCINARRCVLAVAGRRI